MAAAVLASSQTPPTPTSTSSSAASSHTATASMDFTLEHATIEHSPLLIVRAHEPFNAEPTAAALVEFPITPNELVYCRNHGPVQEYDWDAFAVTIRTWLGKGGAGVEGEERSVTFSAREIREKFEKVEVEAALQCAGNRRKEMSGVKPVVGVLWDDGVVANCTWAGARLRDILANAGVQLPLTTVIAISDKDNALFDAPAGPSGIHVRLNSRVTPCEDDAYYGASIPLEKALSEDVLIAYEMNGEPLPPDRGGPVRAVVPGFLGARWVKWIDEIVVCTAESDNYYQARDYKVLSSDVETAEQALAAWPTHPAQTTLPLNSVVASVMRQGPAAVLVKGYAVGRGACRVVRVEVSVDAGATWIPAQITYGGPEGEPKGTRKSGNIQRQRQGPRWGWTLWAVLLTGERVREGVRGTVYSRAIDEEGNVQQRTCPWNYRGVAYCPWGIKAF
ncbi:molybdopterin binding oxidoreductase [Wolfiporia cocos MD-104 SS10]|uniref:Molybdopterin binding oxidoreductase n=1 Tax=Wolfiporia cocos (strain MD-104) TaxID=742152 RepID=A0A2H3JTJ9_WOLCO|nr:molybdopterin binding oxidoreductase [Wolfiporia cocos MD-104 SS10]